MTDWMNMIQKLRKNEGEQGSEKDQFSEIAKIFNDQKICIEYYRSKKKVLYKVTKKSIIIGRATKVDLTLQDPTVSRNHARIEIIDGIPVLIDLGSLSGTQVNGKKITKTGLKSGDTIQVGDTQLFFKVKDTKNSTLKMTTNKYKGLFNSL